MRNSKRAIDVKYFQDKRGDLTVKDVIQYDSLYIQVIPYI